jgi:hypothetical protein
MRKLAVVLFALFALLATPATGYAQDNSAQDEYTENVPAGGGDRPSDNAGGGGSGEGGGSLPPGTVQDFQALGADGEAAAALAEATAPGGENGRDRATGTRGGDGAPATGGGSPIGDVVGDVAGGSGDEGGMGVALPLILGASLLGAIALLVARRRGGSEAGPA